MTFKIEISEQQREILEALLTKEARAPRDTWRQEWSADQMEEIVAMGECLHCLEPTGINLFLL
jgi:hypothetical protein